MSATRIACVKSTVAAAFSELAERRQFVPLERSDVVVALGGDGLTLHSLHEYLYLSRPIFGMNCSTLGFLMNEYRAESSAAAELLSGPDHVLKSQVLCEQSVE